MLELDIAFMRTKFDHYSFSRSRDIVDAYQNLSGSRDLTTPISGIICYPLPALTTIILCQIWSLYLHPLRRLERRYKKSKMGWFVV